MPVLEDIIKCVVSQHNIGDLLPANAKIHELGKAMRLPVEHQDGKAVALTLT